MNRNIGDLPAITTDFDFYGSFRSSVYGRQSNCVSIQQNDDAYLHYNAIVMFENTFKSIFLKRMYMGWIRIAQASQVIQKPLKKQQKLIRIIRQSRSKSNSTNKNISMIIPLTMKCETDTSRTKYKNKHLYPIEKQKTPVTQRISREKYKSHAKYISNQIVKNRTKRLDESPSSVKDIKRDLRLSKLEKAVKKMKRQYEQMKNGRYFLRSNAQSQNNSSIMVFQNEVTYLREEIQRYQLQNYQLSSLLHKKNVRDLNNQKKNTSFEYHSQNYNPDQKRTIYSIPYPQQPTTSYKQQMHQSINKRKSRQKNKQTFCKSFYSQKQIDQTQKINHNYHNTYFIPADFSNSNKNNNLQNISNSFFNPKRHVYDNSKSIEKNINKNHYQDKDVKICRKQCGCCCHHGCKH